MRQAKRPNKGKSPVSIGYQVPPPVGGWNARDALAAMSPQDAPILDNWVPRPGFVEIRRGYVPTVSGFGAAVETLIPYRGGAVGTDKLFAASNGAIYDGLTSPLGAALISGFSSNRWNYTAFATNAAGAWTIACNGAQAPIGYNGGTWAAVPALSGTSGPITLDSTKLVSVFAHAGRLHYIERDSLHVWNPAAGAVGGACTLLDLGAVFSKGGRLLTGDNWAFQLGVTADTFAVYVTDQGQVAIYQGIDPTDASSWSLVGVYDFGPPLGSHALLKFGGDLSLVTTDGIIPLSQGLKLDRDAQGAVAITNKIVNAFSAAAKAYGSNVGWQGLLYPGTSPSNLTDAAGGSLAIYNVPITTLGTSMQFVQNVVTGAWCRFLNINAFCWEIANGKVYFGGSTGVYQWDQGASDNGSPITYDVLSAYSAHAHPGRQKDYKAIRPLMNASPLVQPALDICVDYNAITPTAVPTVIGQGSTTPVIRDDWTGAAGYGMVGAPRMQIILQGDTSAPVLAVGNANGDLLGIDGSGDNLLIQSNLPFDVPCQLLGFDLLYEPGAIIG